MVQPLLELDKVTSGYGEGAVLQGLSLSVDPGTIVGVMGRNGVGKSTFLKTVMGTIKPRGGRIRMSGHDITGAAPFQVAASGIGYVPQGREIFKDFTTEENLLLGNLKATKADLDEVYRLFPVLRERARTQAGAFSGGQQQQLAIARALMGRPALLLLDEPSEGIQPSIVTEIGQMLKQISEDRGVTIVLVEQNIDMVTRICSRAVFMEHGTIQGEVLASEMAGDSAVLQKYLAF
ncbi:ABC transporter ATP-binding protein [Labrenzia sp. 011]|uniref:ABC transporter ATP-binding protein n=1 Tax=Labrenzia sp. 011 TaxID=2171494 RepID=UPI000D5230A6|nr:ABC transporter ATP-binding protein [Labrenzia sp. 011]PVB60132.1 ABC transporter ATP-binding protein [Labrenzia sp. 011]